MGRHDLVLGKTEAEREREIQRLVKSGLLPGGRYCNPKKGVIYSEKKVAERLRNLVRAEGGVVFKVHPMTVRGIPDYIVHEKEGRTFYVEVKTTGEKCTPAQVYVHQILKSCGIETYVLDVVVDFYSDIFVYGYTTYPGRRQRE